MSLLRLLTNRKVIGLDVLTPESAVTVYRELLADNRVTFAAEPMDVEHRWLSMMRMPAASGAAWTDSWLAAFAIELGAKLVSFDAGMGRWPALSSELLVGNVI